MTWWRRRRRWSWRVVAVATAKVGRGFLVVLAPVLAAACGILLHHAGVSLE